MTVWTPQLVPTPLLQNPQTWKKKISRQVPLDDEFWSTENGSRMNTLHT